MRAGKTTRGTESGRRRLRAVWLWVLTMLLLLAGTMCVQAENWTTSGDAQISGSTVLLTRYGTSSSGGVTRAVPIDTRKGFTLGFEYWMGNSVNRAQNGILAVFADSPVHTNKMGYQSYGYWDYVGSSVRFYGVEFNTYGICPAYESRLSQHAGILKGDRNTQKHLAVYESKKAISDGAWHSVRIVYQNATLTVYQDNVKILSAAASLPDLTYLGITAGTNHWGYQYHRIRNIKFSGTNAVKVYFNANGGSCSVTSQYRLSRHSAALPTPSRSGYEFTGWYTAKSGGTKVSPTSYSFSGGQTLYAHWSARKYTLKFDANGGTVGTKQKTVTYASKVGTLPTPKRTKGKFLGWYTAKSGGTKYTASSTYLYAGNRTLYAHWQMTTYKVTFQGNGGTASKSSVKVAYGDKIGTLPTASRKGYSFQGWYTKKSGGTKITSGYQVKKAVTLYAHWKKNSSGGSGGSGSSGGSGGSGSSGRSGSPCAACGGDGRCNHCGGSGFIYRSGAGSLVKSSCPYCTYGKCRVCNGRGTL